jgi:methylated-DNA-protein-cysteine methyltransferase-like protein
VVAEQQLSALHRLILARVREIPEGFVASYGDVSPGAPRAAGAALSGAHDPQVPWYRVVRADGSLAKGERQRKLLEAEGVPMRGDRVDVRVARWHADDQAADPALRSARSPRRAPRRGRP